MKKIMLVAVVLASAVGVYAQGTVLFNNRVTGTVFTRVYNVEPNPTVAISGNTLGDYPVGTTVYIGAPLSGTGYSAQLWGAAGPNQPLSSLAALSGSLTTFRTGTTLPNGYTVGQVQTPAGGSTITIPGSVENGTATVQMRAWNNGNGTYLTWDSATAAGQATGFSNLINVTPLGGVQTTPPNLVGLLSFNLTTTSVPEPSTIALGVIGAAALLFRRRK